MSSVPVMDGSQAPARLAVPLPQARGPLSARLIERLSRPAGRERIDLDGSAGAEDERLALYIAYELHYDGFADVDPAWEWSPALMELTQELERRFEHDLRSRISTDEVEPSDLPARLLGLIAADDAPSLAGFAARNATLEQMREFLIVRSAYQLKEADPHTWAIPRLRGAAKAAMVEIQADEYGGGDPLRIHAALFARSMEALDLDARPNHYLDSIPGEALAGVNLMTMCGLNRRLRGAIVGHLAVFEATSSAPNRSYGNALRRLGLDEQATGFFDEHVVADAIHENLAVYDLAGGLALDQPDLIPDILFGARALLALDADLGGRLLSRWREGRTALFEQPADGS